jgi:hypothetical protein
MLPLTVSGQPLEISLERLGQSMSLYVPLSKGPPDRRAELRFPNWTRLEQCPIRLNRAPQSMTVCVVGFAPQCRAMRRLSRLPRRGRDAQRLRCPRRGRVAGKPGMARLRDAITSALSVLNSMDRAPQSFSFS